MANLVNNKLIIKNTNDNFLLIRKKLYNMSADDGLFETLVGRPAEKWDFHLWIETYGTKWDVKKDRYSFFYEPDFISITFFTDWTPPTGFYGMLMDQYGLDIEYAFYENRLAIGGYGYNNQENYVDLDNISNIVAFSLFVAENSEYFKPYILGMLDGYIVDYVFLSKNSSKDRAEKEILKKYRENIKKMII